MSFVPEPHWPSIVDLATEYWGCQPNKALSTRDEIRFGSKGSKSVKPSTNVWADHESNEGGGYIDLYRRVHGKPPPANGARSGNCKVPLWEDIETTYPYRTADGTLLFEVVRTLSKEPRFRQRRPLGCNRWKWSIKDAIPTEQRPLYRLPELLAAPPGSTVFIAEGEKDVDNLRARGLIA